MGGGVLPGDEQNPALLYARGAVGLPAADACRGTDDSGACRFTRNLMVLLLADQVRRGWTVPKHRLVWCPAYSWCFAARDFGLPLGASDAHTLQRSVRSEQRRGRPKGLLPEGLRRKWPGASLLLSHRSLRICSFVAPRPRPFWAQRNTSYMRDTTLVKQTVALRTREGGGAGSSRIQKSPRSGPIAKRGVAWA